MAVDDQYLLDSVIGDTLGNTDTEGDEDLWLDVDGAREVDVMQVRAVRNQRRHQDSVCCLQTHCSNAYSHGTTPCATIRDHLRLHGPNSESADPDAHGELRITPRLATEPTIA
jgi:hypothetical protein